MKKLAPVFILVALASYGIYYHFSTLPPKYFSSGQIEAEEIHVSSKVIGRIAKIFVDESDTVKMGQILAALDDSDLAQRDYERAARLFQEQALSAEQYEKLSKNRDNFILRSPINGLVILKSLKTGEIATPGTPLLVLADLKHLWIKTYVPITRMREVQLGMTANIHVDAYPEKVFQGKVVQIASQMEYTPKNVQSYEERIKQFFAVKIAVDNSDQLLKIGMPADVRLNHGPHH